MGYLMFPTILAGIDMKNFITNVTRVPRNVCLKNNNDESAMETAANIHVGSQQL